MKMMDKREISDKPGSGSENTDDLMLEKNGERQLNISQKVTDALGKTFFAANYADLRRHRYVTVQSMDYARKMVEGCETIEQAFESFIQTLVRPEYQEEMRAFCDSATIAERVKGKRQIDCVYLSKVASGWCKASFYPCEWDEDGEVTHVLFAVAPLADQIALEIEEGIANRRDLTTIFDLAPVSIVVYQWDGQKLTFMNANHCYKEFFDYEDLKTGDEPDYQAIHKDDIEEYREAIRKALTETHHLEYVFRIWNSRKNSYGWRQINAAAKPQGDGTSLVYAVFTDVTDQKIAELRLEKSRASIMASLGASDQFSYEYDPVKHTSTSFAMNSAGYKLDSVIRNYPECFRESDFMHPDDVETFIETVHKIDAGAENAHCIIRANLNGKYRWHSCTFDAYYDWEKEYRIALLTVVDITPQVMVKQDYEERIRSLLSVQKNILSMCTFNAEQDTYETVHTEAELREYVDRTPGFEAMMMLILPNIVDAESRDAYRRKFSRENLLRQAELGHTHLEEEFLLKLSEDHYGWVTTIVELVKNPLTDEISGVAYCKSTQKSHMEHELLVSALKQDYVFSAIIYKDTDEFYLYNSESDSFSERREHFWESAFSSRDPKCSPETVAYIKNFFKKESMCHYLDSHAEFAYAFDSSYYGSQKRVEAKFRYLDKNHRTILFTIRDITDQRLLKKWKYESEHDPLTGLYNRNRVFEKCRELLTKYPDEQFVMLHADIQHFHLYNTFFGEEAGDRLLRKLAELLTSVEREYEYAAYGRIESDVFCVLFPEGANLFEDHVLRCIKGLNTYSSEFPLKVAIGAYWVTDPSMDIEAMFSRATIAAKSDKHNLFGLVSCYDDVMDQDLKDTQQITSEMTGAIAQEQFEVYLQPKYSLRSEKLVGAEALARWKHPERGMISPGKFIPAFEQNGFIANLDRYMWEHVCQILRRWQNEGKAMYPVSVNISRVSMYNHATVSFLKSLIEKYQIDPGYLELELTETAYMDDPEDLKCMLKELQEYGFHILMDDFGSGYSSLNTLRDLPVNVLKLDMKFLSTAQNDARGNAVLSSVVRMSKLLNLPIVAEGVETQEQADYLRSIGCEYVQGYLFAKPMPAAEYEKLLSGGAGAALSLEEKEAVSDASADLVLEEPFHSLGVLEYSGERFAYLRTNKKFLEEFDLIENLKPASKVFREHMDDRSYGTLLQAFALCSEKKKEVFCSLEWLADDGKIRSYHAYVRYHGKIGSYADLSVTFMNVTDIERVASDEDKDSIQDDLELRSVLFGSVKKLVTGDDIENSTNSILEDVLDYYDADRAYIFEFDWESKIGINTYEVCAPLVTPAIDDLQDVPLDVMRVWIDLFSRNSLIHIKDLKALLSDESRKDEYDILADQGIQSLIAAPVYYKDELRGFLGVDNPKRRLDETAYLKNLAVFCVNITARERKRAVLEKQNMRDPLTGVYNRYGYDEILKQYKADQRPAAYIQIDVDDFKSLNDTYGHAFGDEVLKQVAVQLTDAFRKDDFVFRFGGDEFAVLLTNCRFFDWKIISEKQRRIHLRINQILKKRIDVTLSMGISFSESGFDENMIAIADAALYQVKNNGRAGCCVLDADHKVTYEWKDDIGGNKEGNALDQSDTGACRIELPAGDLSQGRLICNETARVLLGFDPSMSPEECFRFWLNRMDPYSREHIIKTRQAMLEKGQAECTYIYHHPMLGEIMVRSGGRCLNNEDGMVFYGYHQSLQNTRIVLYEDDSQKMIDALLGLYFASYYVDLQQNCFFTLKSTKESRHLDKQAGSASGAVQGFVQTLVKPEYREAMSKFMDLDTLPERLRDRSFVEAEYQSMIEEKGWCRVRIFAVKRDEAGVVTHVQILVASIGREGR